MSCAFQEHFVLLQALLACARRAEALQIDIMLQNRRVNADLEDMHAKVLSLSRIMKHLKGQFAANAALSMALNQALDTGTAPLVAERPAPPATSLPSHQRGLPDAAPRRQLSQQRGQKRRKL